MIKELPSITEHTYRPSIIPEGINVENTEAGVYEYKIIKDYFDTPVAYDDTSLEKSKMTTEEFFNREKAIETLNNSKHSVDFNSPEIFEAGFDSTNKTAKEYICNLNDEKIAPMQYLNSELVKINNNEIQQWKTSARPIMNGCREFFLHLSNVKEIGDYAFAGNNHLTDIDIASDDVVLGKGAFAACDKVERINIPDAVKEIPDECFLDCDNIFSIKLPADLERIGSRSFADCDYLNFVHVPPHVEEIGDEAFKDCGNLIDVGLSRNNSLKRIGEYACENCDNLTHIIIPDSVTEIGDGAFAGCENLSEIKISSKLLANIDIDSVFKDTDLNLDSLHERAEAYKKYKDADIVETQEYAKENITEYTCDENKPVFIKSEAFLFCEDLEKVNMPNQKAYIGDSAFAGCVKLNDIDLSKVEHIGAFTFENCESLEKVNLESVEEMNEDAFCRCENLKEVKLSDKLTYIPKGAFVNCGFTNIDIPSQVDYIGRYAFCGTKLESVTIPSEVLHIDFAAFQSCKNLKEVNLSEGLGAISQNAFKDCKSLTSISIPDSVGYLGDMAFAGCENLSEINISEKLLADIDIDSVFKGTNLDMNKLHEIADNYREEHEQEFNDMDDIENKDIDDEDHDDL